MSKHTPEPWIINDLRPSYPITILSESGVGICDMLDELDVESKARLIAAAPDTAAERDRLKALNVELLETVEELLKEAPRGTTYLKARSLLAKAEEA